MTEPQAMEPSAQIAPQYMIAGLQEQVLSLTQENSMYRAFTNQLIDQIRELEQRLEPKENDGSGSPPPDPEPPSGQAQEKRNGSVGGPSPADVARRARTRGGKQ